MPADRQLVVGAAVVRGGRVLAARRVRPDSARGRWELPGGKVEPGEDPAAALVREIREELGCTIRVTGRLPGEQDIDDRFLLRVLLAGLCSGEPKPREHDALRWLGPGELGDVDWLAPDRPFLPALRSVLTGPEDGGAESDVGGAIPATDAARSGLRALFWTVEEATEVAAVLLDRGFEATLSRERFAGEDDDEDHPWAVSTDAAPDVVAPLVDHTDGWLEAAGPEPARPPQPLDLPQGPLRPGRRSGC